MKRQTSLARTKCSKAITTSSKTACTEMLLPLLLLLTLSATVQAQFRLTATNGLITITGFTGSDESVTIPNTINGLPVTGIGANAFSDCFRLTNVTIGSSVTNIGEGAFDLCFGLTAITVDAVNPVYSDVAGVLFDKSQTTLIFCPQGKAGTYTIPSSTTSIGDNAFSACSGLTNVLIPSSVTNIGSRAFSICYGLTNLTVGSSVTSLGEGVFSYCHNLTNVSIPVSVTSIGTSVFYNCTSLTSVTIPISITNIGAWAFYGCSSLTNVPVFGSVSSILDGTFVKCLSLTNVAIPSSVTSIGDWAFAGCSNLTSATIHGSLTNIGTNVFESSGLTGVYFVGNAPSVGLSVFSDDNNATVYYLPGTTNWGTTFGGRPTALWIPKVQTSDGTFGMSTNGFGFNINWASGMTIVVDACTNVVHPSWSPLQTNNISGGTVYFSDPRWANYPARFYRIRWP